MTSIRLLCYPAAVLLILSASSLCPTSATKSLWGQKLKFKGLPCLWQLRPEVVIPALDEFSACILVNRLLPSKWTGFVYKAPGDREIELGLGGSSDNLTVWLFGREWNFQLHMAQREWYYFCITWLGKARRLKIYINGEILDEVAVLPITSWHVAPNGTLSLGVSHFLLNGEVQPMSGTDLVGEISLFKVWSTEYGAEELKRLSCADGDVVSWAKDFQERKDDCPPEPDNYLQCVWSHYKIQMQTTIVQSNYSSKCPKSLEKMTDVWLNLIFPNNISVLDISVSSPSHSCYMVNNSTPPQAQQPQGLDAESNSSCDKCFSCEVFVNVHPAAKVDVVQAQITALLNFNFPSKFLNLIADPDSITILPVGLLATEVPPTVSTAASDEHPTLGPPPRPANMSTTAEPLNPNETAVEADHFFKVNLILNMTGSPPNPKDTIENWLKNQLEQNRTMTVLNPLIEDISGKNTMRLMISHRKQKQFNCTFNVQVYNSISVDQAMDVISSSLMSNYESGSIIITTMALDIKHIFPGNCLEEQINSIFYGQYIWPETFPQDKAEMICWKPDTGRASRLCKLDIETDVSSWAEPDLTECELLVTISDLDNVTVTPGNADEVVDAIQELVNVELGNSEELSPSNLNSVVEKLSEVVDKSIIRPTVGVDIVNIIADILNSKTHLTPVADTILLLAERMGDNMDIQNESLSIVAPSLAFSMINTEPEKFSGLTFGVSSVSSTLNPEIFLNQSFVDDPLPETVATISLPPALRNLFQPGEKNSTRIQFRFYAKRELFENPASSAESNRRVTSYIVSASINNSRVVNLPSEDRVVVTLTHPPLQQTEDQVHCMFWDVQMNDGGSGWNSSGCETRSISPTQTSCRCDHLTHFALLLDVSRTPISETDSQILTLISYLGCGISCIFLGVTLLTYLFFEKLRRDYPSKILINLSAALLGLGMVFLVNSWLSSFSNYGLCIATAATLHYFLLASFAWMGLEAVHMYLALVKVFNTYIPSYILKFCAVGWGIPLVIVSLVLAIDKDVYGGVLPADAVITLQSTGSFCWLKNDACFYATVISFILLILLGNVFVFIVVLIQIRRTRANKPSETSRGALQDLRAVASLTVLLGLTWSMGLLSFGPGRVAMMYLFVICNSFQGFFVFLFHCLMKENVRKQWRSDLCCGRFRLNTFLSDRSRSDTNGGRTKKSNLNNSDSLFSDSTTTLGSSATSSSNKHSHHGA